MCKIYAKEQKKSAHIEGSFLLFNSLPQLLFSFINEPTLCLFLSNFLRYQLVHMEIRKQVEVDLRKLIQDLRKKGTNLNEKLE